MTAEKAPTEIKEPKKNTNFGFGSNKLDTEEFTVKGRRNSSMMSGRTRSCFPCGSSGGSSGSVMSISRD